MPLLVASPARVLDVSSDLLSARRLAQEQRRTIEEGWLFDYGAATSIRQAATGDRFRRYFLELDADVYDKVLRDAMGKAISDFLAEHGVDTDQVAQQLTVINENKTVFKGKIDMRGAQGVALGTGAKAGGDGKDGKSEKTASN